MRIHILGICGTFMAGIARIAKEMGHEVVGSDVNIYPPMSHQLKALGIELFNGFDPAPLETGVDCVIVGNVIKRGNPAIEYVMEHNLPYVSGPEWLAQNVLSNYKVIAVSGTHGKTTTTSMLAWILEQGGMAPGFLIGGVPENFGVSARLGTGQYFVIEADEYDSAFFDKRSKFIHYRPHILILNNLEFDHADIFPNLAAIQQQFHYLLRTVPKNGLIIYHRPDENLQCVIEKGCWSPLICFDGPAAEWQAEFLNAEGDHFAVSYQQKVIGQVNWPLLGKHNVNNALAALAAAIHVGVPYAAALGALSTFKNVKRRLEIRGNKNEITIYDDFAHHPTAIQATLEGLRAKVGKSRIVVILEFGSYTMRSGAHQTSIKKALNQANKVFCKSPAVEWGLKAVLNTFTQPTALFDDVDHFVKSLVPTLKKGDHVLVMSNSDFGGIHQKLLDAL